MLRFHVCSHECTCQNKNHESHEYEIGTVFTFKGIFTFVTEPAQSLTVNFA